MHQARNLLQNIHSYQQVLQAQIEYAVKNTQQINSKIAGETGDTGG